MARAFSEWKMRHFYQQGQSEVSTDVFVEEAQKDMQRIIRASHPTEEDEGVPQLNWARYLEDCTDVDQPKPLQKFQPLIGRGMYDDQLRNWRKYFPLHQFHIISSEQLRKNPAETLNGVAAFLGIDSTFYHEGQSFLEEQKNVGGRTFSAQEGKEQTAGTSKEPSALRIPKEFEAKLYEFYKPYNQRFYREIGQQFEWDKKV